MSENRNGVKMVGIRNGFHNTAVTHYCEDNTTHSHIAAGIRRYKHAVIEESFP